MPMYAIAIKPLINQMEEENLKQVWFADDATAGGNLTHLKACMMVGSPVRERARLSHREGRKAVEGQTSV